MQVPMVIAVAVRRSRSNLVVMELSRAKRTLGRTGLKTSAIGLGSGYGLSGYDVERAFDAGINYFYWGSPRRRDFGDAIRRLGKRVRQDMVVVVQSYSRSRLALAPSVESALRRLQLDYADILVLGWWNRPPTRPDFGCSTWSR